jgi:acetyl/propionyl-CoA carboxylase alpha subunit
MAVTLNTELLTNATTGDDGSGIFDLLMQKLELHLDEQYRKGRIKGTDYANVYVQSVQSVLDQSAKLLQHAKQLDHDASLHANSLTSNENIASAKNTHDANLHANTLAQDLLVTQAKMNLETTLEQAKLNTQIALENTRNELTENLETAKLDLEVEKLTIDTKMRDKQLDLEAEVSKAKLDQEKYLKTYDAHISSWTTLYVNNKVVDRPIVTEATSIDSSIINLAVSTNLVTTITDPIDSTVNDVTLSTTNDTANITIANTTIPTGEV